MEPSEDYVRANGTVLKGLVSRIFVRSALRIKNLNCFRDEMFLASVGRLFLSFGPV